MDIGWRRVEGVLSIWKAHVWHDLDVVTGRKELKKFTLFCRKDVLPKSADWIKQSVASFDPENSKVITDIGDVISYEFLVVAMGLQLNYNLVIRETFCYDKVQPVHILCFR